LHILLLSAGKVFKSPYGGEDLFTRLLAKWISGTHHAVTLLGIEFAGMRVRYLTNNGRDSDLTPVSRSKKNQNIGPGYLLYSLRSVIWMLQVLKIFSVNMIRPISIIHAQDSGYTGLAAIVAGKILNIPVVITLHGIRYTQIKSNPFVNHTLKKIVLKLERKLDMFTLRRANVVTVVSSTLKEYVQELAPDTPLVTIPVALNLKKYSFSPLKRVSLRKEMGLENKFTIVGFVGRLSYEKNLFTLIKSFANALQSNSSLRLILAGEGPLESELRKLTINMHIIDKVIFCGFRNDVDRILSGIDIFVLPSLIEGTSNALLQAMACGRAIICSDIPGNRELVTNNRESIIVEPQDQNGLCKAIISLASDEMLRNRLGSNAKIIAEKYSEEKVFPKFTEHYDNLIQLHQKY
jgi:glycosyltransferase involved in cell wall biosynthesis